MGSTGVTVIVFCFNSEKIIGTTLTYIHKQVFCTPLNWEVILIDNNSTDATRSIALATWTSFKTDVPLRIVKEEKQGLNYARERGLAEARYSFVIFCDDDNWLFSNYVETASEIMDSNQDIAAVGGYGTAVFSGSEPDFFKYVSPAYAVDEQNSGSSAPAEFLYGAGLVVRKSVYEEYIASGYTSALTDRRGIQEIASGGDYELTLMFRIMGYRLLFSKKLRFYHFIDDRKLNWDYLKKLYSSFGVATALLIPHQIIIKNKGWLRSSLVYNILGQLYHFLKKVPLLAQDRRLFLLEFHKFRSHVEVAVSNQKTLRSSVNLIKKHVLEE